MADGPILSFVRSPSLAEQAARSPRSHRLGQKIRDEKDAVIMGPHHRHLRDLIAKGDIAMLTVEIPAISCGCASAS
jgi:hypothetical protein